VVRAPRPWNGTPHHPVFLRDDQTLSRSEILGVIWIAGEGGVALFQIRQLSNFQRCTTWFKGPIWVT
jgi:hypothetical protein